MGSILQVKNIETLYYGLIKALRGISLDIQEGHFRGSRGQRRREDHDLKTVMGFWKTADKRNHELLGSASTGCDAEDILNLGIHGFPKARGFFRAFGQREPADGAYIRKDRKGSKRNLELVIGTSPF